MDLARYEDKRLAAFSIQVNYFPFISFIFLFLFFFTILFFWHENQKIVNRHFNQISTIFTRGADSVVLLNETSISLYSRVQTLLNDLQDMIKVKLDDVHLKKLERFVSWIKIWNILFFKKINNNNKVC